MNLTIYEKQSTNGVVILSVSGFIDTSTSAVFEEKIKELYSGNKTKIVLDLSKTEFISSAGWGIMIAYLRKMRNGGGDICIASMTENVDKVFKLMEFDNLINSYKIVEDAVKSFGD